VSHILTVRHHLRLSETHAMACSGQRRSRSLPVGQPRPVAGGLWSQVQVAPQQARQVVFAGHS
jgi:hypothetical protein